jgi:hypothetical protein
MRAAVRSALAVAVALAACEPPGYHKHTVAPDAPTGGGNVDAPKVTDAGGDAAAAACTQGFRLDPSASAGASTVVLTGDWLHWAGDTASGAIAMTKGGDAAWTVSHGFAPGTYQYKFVLDGSMWIADPANPNSIDDGFGGKNSVYTCQ